MCDICKMMLLEDHNMKSDVELPFCRCGVFRKQPESAECYHCFNKRSELEKCPICDSLPPRPM